MLEGFYTAASGIMMQQRTLDVLTNNIANVQTPGFRASRVVSTTFEQEFLTRIEQNNTAPIGKGAPIRIVSETPTRFDANSLEESGRPYDVAIDGTGFFNVQAPEDAEGNEGPQYLTRNGNFDVDGEGMLALPGVGVVLGKKGPIELDDANFTIDPDGGVYNARGRLVDTLLVTVPPQDAQMTQAANGLFQVENFDQNKQITADQARLVQGWTERSNIDVNREYTLVMEAQRALQSCSSALQIIDKINQKAASQIAAL